MPTGKATDRGRRDEQALEADERVEVRVVEATVSTDFSYVLHNRGLLASIRHEAAQRVQNIFSQRKSVNENAISSAEYELIKSQAIVLLSAELLDSPRAHLDYIRRTVAGALSEDVGTR